MHTFTHLPSSLLLNIPRYIPIVELPRLFCVCKYLNVVLNSEEACGFWSSWLVASSIRYTVLPSEINPKAVRLKLACYRMLRTRYCRRVSFLASQRAAIKSGKAEIGRLGRHTVAVMLEKICVVILLPALVLALYLCVFSDSRYWNNVFPSSMIAQSSLAEVRGVETCMVGILSVPLELQGVAHTGVIYLLIASICGVLGGLWYLFARGQKWYPSDDILVIYRRELENSGLHLHFLFLSSPFLGMLFLTPLLAFVDAALATLLMLFPWHTLPPPALADVLALVYTLEVYLCLRVLLQKYKKHFLLWRFLTTLRYECTRFSSLIFVIGCGLLPMIFASIMQFLFYFGWFVQRLCVQFVEEGSVVWSVALQLDFLKSSVIAIEPHAFVCAFAPLLVALQWICLYGVFVVCCAIVHFSIVYRQHKHSCELRVQQTESDLAVNMQTLGLQW